MISLMIAQKYADGDCEVCEGIGTHVTNEEGDEAYCDCVKRNREEQRGEDLAELNKGN